MKPWIWALIATVVALPVGLTFMVMTIVSSIFGDSLVGNGFTAWAIGWLAGVAATIGMAREQAWGRYGALVAAALMIVGAGIAVLDSGHPASVVFAVPGIGFAIAGLIQEPEPTA